MFMCCALALAELPPSPSALKRGWHFLPLFPCDSASAKFFNVSVDDTHKKAIRQFLKLYIYNILK